MTTVLYPTLSRRAGSAQFSRALGHGLAQVLVWTVPAAAWLIVAAEPIMRLLYQRGQFSPADAAEAARLLALYATGLPAWSLAQMLPRAYHARQEMTRPLEWQALAVAGYLALAPPLTWAWGARGVAGAFALYSYLTLGIFLWGLRRELGPVAGALARAALHAAFAAAALALATLAVLGALPVLGGGGLAGQAARVGLAGVAGLSAYVACMTALHGFTGGRPGGARAAPIPDPAEDLDEAGC
jgi:putative peptidoglycan lipid II flippase